MSRRVGAGLLAAMVLAGAGAAQAGSVPSKTTNARFSKQAIGSPTPQRAVGHVTVRSPTAWSRSRIHSPGPDKRESIGYAARLSPTCIQAVVVGADLNDSRSAAAEVRRDLFNQHVSGTRTTGKMSQRGGVWGLRIDETVGITGVGSKFEVEGIAALKLAPRNRIARLKLMAVSSPGCTVADVPALLGPVKHLLRTARFHARLVTASR